MRVEDPITRHGKFWLPRDPKRTIPGILTIADGGTVALELLVDDESSWFEPGSSPKAPRILGLLENDLTVTLDGCHYQRWGFFGLRRDKLYVGMAILGLQFEENEDVSLIEFEFSIEGLAEWLQIRSIVVDYNFVERVSRLDHTIPGDVTVALSSGFVLTFCFGANYLGNTLTRAEIVQTVAIRLTADTARPIDEFRMIAHRLTNFLRLALDTHVSITSARIKPPEAAGATTAVDRHRWTADVYFRSLPFSTDVPVIRHHDALFDYNRIQENLQERLNRWLDTYEVTHSIFSSYFSATQSNLRFIEERFLMMLRGLEGYHRATSTDTRLPSETFDDLVARMIACCPPDHREWVQGVLRHSNDLSLRNRLRRLLEPFGELFGDARTQRNLVDEIVSRRNALIHMSVESIETTEQYVRMAYLCDRVDALFQLHLLSEVDFTSREVIAIAQGNERLKWKLRSPE